MANAIQKAERAPTLITNIQKLGAYRLCGERTDMTTVREYIDIPAGETVAVPAHIWDRYKDRPDIRAADLVHIVVGGLEPGQQLKTPTAQEMALRVREKELASRQAAIEKSEKELAVQKAEFDSKMSEAMGI